MFALMKEFELRGINVKSKIAVPLIYKGHEKGKYFETDILVENEIIMEIKSTEIMHPVYSAQIISYLRLTNKPLGYMVNFNVPVLKNRFRRYVNHF